MLTITSDTVGITVDMGAYYTNNIIAFKRGYWRKEQVLYILENSNHVEVDASDKNDWALNFDGNGVGYQVATINGVAPTSNADIFDKLKAILG